MRGKERKLIKQSKNKRERLKEKIKMYLYF